MTMMKAIIIPMVLILVSPGATAGLWQKRAVFLQKSNSNYVKLVPLEYQNLHALTLCMRLASEEVDGRDVILFSYASSSTPNEVHMWREQDGRYSFYLKDNVTYFKLPTLDALVQHLCVTWDSATGQTAFWINGRPTLTKFLARDHTIAQPVVVMIGQDQDSLGGSFEEKQSFVGEQADVHLWDYVLSADEIKAVSQGCSLLGGNILNWDRGEAVTGGIVSLQSACRTCSSCNTCSPSV
uniref:C-reactive protein-like n=1 Tax=Pristiophorus japonicus TaxID=55135 RepID=UPI00398E445C